MVLKRETAGREAAAVPPIHSLQFAKKARGGYNILRRWLKWTIFGEVSRQLMAIATFHFPRGFLWGAATSATQVEGGQTNSNWWTWQQEPGRILHDHKIGAACDWWNGRWREDFDRAAEGGQNAHRLSIEWSRVQPAPDRWDEHALDRYREMVRGLVERGMTPLVTLYHFGHPQWLDEAGGWENERAVEWFEKYARKVVDALREYVTLWVTLNEPNLVVIFGYLNGVWPPGKQDLGAGLKAAGNLLRAHGAAYRAIHALQPQSRVGFAHHYRGFQPARGWNPLDRTITRLYNTLFNDLFVRAIATGVMRYPAGRLRLPEIKGAQDYLGINYYTREKVAFNLLRKDDFFARRYYPQGAALSEGGFIANIPEGLFEALQWGKSYGLPLIITENGINDQDDNLRPRYMIEHIHQVWRAVNFNFPIKGYFHWTLVDNFEWERGWAQRFGLWELDPETQVRRKRPSADLYAEICRENGISAEMVARFAPALFPQMFPN